MSNTLNTDNLTYDQYADGYEGFVSLYYDYDAADAYNGPGGLYAVDAAGAPVGFMVGGTVDEYMQWVYINLK